MTRILVVSLGILSLCVGCARPPGAGSAVPDEERLSRRETTRLSLTGGARSSAESDADTRTASRGIGVASGIHGAVASAEAQASAVGAGILKRGGNAVDAAIAVAFALGVTEPSAGNIGGGGFMLVHSPAGEDSVFDYREVAPLAARRDMFLDRAGNLTDLSERGPLAAGVPGVVAGLALAHARYGRLSWRELVLPAIALARDGHQLDDVHAAALLQAARDVREFRDRVRSLSASTSRATVDQNAALLSALTKTLTTFAKADGRAYLAGEIWRQPELAGTLEQLAERGPQEFYTGATAQRMASEVERMGGVWTPADLEQYRAIERRPLSFPYRGYQVLSVPPPSGGGVVLREILAGAEAVELHSFEWESADRVHLFVEIARRAYADRNQLLGDPAFVKMPIERLLSADYARSRVLDIDPEHATPSTAVGSGVPLNEGLHTTHFSVLDSAGMAVSNTFTLNTDFGALVQIPGTGITLNNEMDDFSAKPGSTNGFGLVQGEQNAIAPGKRMLSSMTPTIVLRDARVRAVLGSPGGPTITTTVAQVLLQLVDHRRTLEQAIAAPRVHEQWLPDEVLIESALPTSTRSQLEAMGHHLRLSPSIGHANCIAVDPISGLFTAVADVTRGGGGAAAY